VISSGTLVALFSFREDTEEIVTRAECALCETRYGLLVAEAFPFTYNGALATVAAHLECLHPQLGNVEYKQFAIAKPALSDGRVAIVLRATLPT
jgi:hypothetical protein